MEEKFPKRLVASFWLQLTFYDVFCGWLCVLASTNEKGETGTGEKDPAAKIMRTGRALTSGPMKMLPFWQLELIAYQKCLYSNYWLEHQRYLDQIACKHA